MTNPSNTQLRFTTSAGMFPASWIAEDSRSIGLHLVQCRAARGRGFDLLRVAETAGGFVAGRLITTLAVVVAGTVAFMLAFS